MKDRYALFGHPVAHSRSPRIYARFGLELETLEVAPAAFADAVRGFGRAGGRGANVTLPHKLEAARVADALSVRARLAGAVNVLRYETDGIVFGDNTDGAGLVADLAVNMGLELEGKRVLVIGAGGACRGIVAPLLALAPGAVTIANRDPDKAALVAARFASLGRVHATALDGAGEGHDLVINATSTSLTGDVPAVPPVVFGDGCIAYDLAYGDDRETAFTRWARSCGAGAAVDGWGMLVEQAAESYSVWFGERPDTSAIT